MSFYSFLRGMDDISDSPVLQREEKREQLRMIRLGFQENQPEMLPEWALPYYKQVQDKKLSHEHGDKLWQAFWQDTEKSHYRSFSEVVSYCKLSAVPVGRAVLEISGEPKPKLAAADALCIALQLINHLQDVRSDYLERKRVYLPQDWLEQQGLSEKVLHKAETGPKLRHVLNMWLDEIDKYLRQAGHLPNSIRHRGLRWELRIMLALARGLARKLRRADSMAEHVKLGKFHRAILGLGAIIGVC